MNNVYNNVIEEQKMTYDDLGGFNIGGGLTMRDFANDDEAFLEDDGSENMFDVQHDEDD